MRTQLLSGILLSAIFATAIAANSSSTQSQTQSKTDKPITIAPNQSTLELNLTANPTTGYNWYLSKYADRFFKLESYKYLPANTKLVGAPGKAVFTFKVKPSFHHAPFITHMVFKYMRPWESGSGAKKTLTILSIPADKANTQKNTKSKEKHHVKKQFHATPVLSSKQIDQGLNSVAENTAQKAQQKNWLSAPHAGTPPPKSSAEIQQAAPVKAAKPAAKKNPNNWLSVTVS